MFRYVDLFCGIGGFHQGVDRVSSKRNFESKCLFAADNDFYAAKVYERNYGVSAFFDLTKDETHQQISIAIGDEGLTCLFAGFPCQPFSKAGDRQGFDNQVKGTLFFELLRIINKHKPSLVLLENVRNLKNHDEGNTWNTIKGALDKSGYSVEDTIISPNNIKKIPALRERFFILAFRSDLQLNEKISKIKELNNVFFKTSIFAHSKIEYGLNSSFFNTCEQSNIDPKRIEVIEMWNELFHLLKDSNKNLISPL
ncbi:MAG: DNA (cytosine-5-)-methyltransferase, partial [Ignavibacteria bacterium]|nr:DNA (cytosine-5-)-methyltransferase [Ignavibacteria bacterium]